MELDRTLTRVSQNVPTHSDRVPSKFSPATPLDGSPSVVDLCCGLGGLSLAAQQLGMTIAVGVDTNKDSLKTFSRNFPGAETIAETISGTRAVERCGAALLANKERNVPIVLLSGPPCQGFSSAGTRDPKDKRNKVLLAVARAIASLRPDCALVENVQETLTDKHRKRISDFEAHLLAAGYRMLTVELNAKDFGVAQRRQRAFFLITRRKVDKELALKRLTQLQMAEIPCEKVLEDLPDAETRGTTYSDEDELLRSPANHLAMRHTKAVRAKIAKIPPGSGPMSYRKLDPKKPASTLFSGHRAPPAHYKYPRSITVREAARLQGFPDDFRVFGSFANQMMQVTNAVPPPLARAVLRVLVELSGIRFNPHA